MIKKYSIILLAIFLLSCGTTQNKSTANSSSNFSHKWEMPELSAELEQIDPNLFKEQDSFQRFDNGWTEKYSKMEERFRLISYSDENPFYTSKYFYPNGSIMNKVVAYQENLIVGNIYYYSEEGDLCDIHDTQNDYDFDLMDVLEYCDRKNIPYYTGDPDKRKEGTTIYKDYERGKWIWVIEYMNSKKMKNSKILLDGKTGKRLKEKKELLIFMW